VFTNGLKKNTYAYPSLEAFANGVKAVGDNVEFVKKRKYVPCDIAVIFGDIRNAPKKKKRMINLSQIKGRHINRGLIVIDTAVLTRATAVGSEYRRIGINGFLRNEAEFSNTGMPPDRWKKISSHAKLNIQPWKKNGKHITIALQRPVDASLKNSERLRPYLYKSWVLQLINELKKKTDIDIHIRPHPDSFNQDEERNWLQSLQLELSDQVTWDTRPISFEEAMQECKLCISYNSGAGVDAACLGIPVMVCDPGSFAWDIAIHDVKNWHPESPYTPDRSQWLNDLSYIEWDLTEISKGMPWMHLKSYLQKNL
jgi:hypothetical protein